MNISVALTTEVYELIYVGWLYKYLNFNKSLADYAIGLKELRWYLVTLNLNNLFKIKYVTLAWDKSKMIVLQNIRIICRV